MKAIKVKVCDLFRTVWQATKATIDVCFFAARKEMMWILACGLGFSVLKAATSFVNAQVISHASVLIKDEVNHKALSNGGNGLYDIFKYLSMSGLLYLAMAFGILASVNAFTRLISYITSTNWSDKVRYEVDARIRKHRSKLDIGKLRSAEYEDIKSRIMEQPYGWSAIENHAKLLSEASANFFNLFIFGLGLVWFNPWYALILFAGVLFPAISEFYWDNRWWEFNDNETSFSRRRGVFSSLFSNVVPLFELKFFGRAHIANAGIINSQKNRIMRRNKIVRGDAFWSIIAELANAFVFICVILHAIYAAVLGGNIGLLVITLDFSVRFVGNLKEVLFNVSDGWKATRSVAVITNEFFSLQPLILQEGTKVPENFEEFIIRDLHFTYPGSEKPALRGINLSFKRGSKIALVGESGGGKSTLASLLGRQYDPQQGGIYLDSLNLRHVHPEEWEKECLCMGQDFAIPHVTVREAICYGRWVISNNGKDHFDIDLGVDKVDIEEVKRACQRANFLHVVEAQPDGFDSLIGTEQDGIELSKGQKQRLALAARLLAERNLMIYDEPDASLDNTNKEKAVEGILDTTSTVVLVIHNLRACEKCDHVAYIDDGLVVEFGTHAELLQKNGLYAEMYRKQVAKENGNGQKSGQ